ncbi:alpha/beta-hydrolase [Apiospora arundinis]
MAFPKCNGDLATYPPQARRGSVAFVGKSHIPSSATTTRGGHAANRYVRHLPVDISRRIEDELYALNLLQLTRDYPLAPYCLRYPLDFLLGSLPDEVRRRVVIPLDPATSHLLESKLFSVDEATFAEALEYFQQQQQQPQRPRQRPLPGHENDEEDEEDDDEDGDEGDEGDDYPEFFRDIRDHGEYVFWPVDVGDYQWLLCVLHLKRSPARSYRKATYDQVTDFAVVDPEWSDGSGSGCICAQSKERVQHVTARLVEIFRRGGIDIDPSRTQRELWIAPSTIISRPETAAVAAAMPAIGGDGNPPQPPPLSSSSRWESGVRCFQLTRELLRRVTDYTCPGTAGYEDERFFEGTSGWVDADAVRHEMVGMALQRCNAALGYACRYYLAPIDTLVLVGDIDKDGEGNGNGNGDNVQRRIAQPDALQPSRVGKRLLSGWMRGMEEEASDQQVEEEEKEEEEEEEEEKVGGSQNVSVAAATSAVAMSCQTKPPQTPLSGMHNLNSIAINQRPTKRTARDADLDNQDDEDSDGGEVSYNDSPAHQTKRPRTTL